MSDNIGLAVDLAQKKRSSREEQVQRLKDALLQARSVILRELSPAGSTMAESPAEAGADIFDQSANELERTLCLLLRNPLPNRV